MKTLTLERLREALSYCPNTGIFTWRMRPSNRVRIGREAGSRHGCGYIQINIDGENHLAHRLAWLFVYGEWPKNVIDHINGNRKDNRICNLRDVRHDVNAQNIRHPKSTNTSGLLGVSWSKKDRTFVAHISVRNKTVHIGSFCSADKAHAAYLAAKRKIHSGCTI